MLHDLRSPETAFAYFTVVAATDVLAVRLLAEGFTGVAVALVGFAALVWFVFGYLLPWQVLMRRDGRPILARTNGTWFIWAVASQSLAIGMSMLQPLAGRGQAWVALLAVLSWSVGVALYAAVAMLVLLRIVHFGITAEQFEPPYWVTMGAMAIAVVAGSRIVEMEPTPMVEATGRLIAGTVAIFWTFCLWLIPMLIGAGFWRHVRHRVPLRYVPTLWSIVFPVGMFAVASINLGRVDRLPIVEGIGSVTLVVAVLVWVVVFVAMLRHVVRVATGRAAALPSGRAARRWQNLSMASLQTLEDGQRRVVARWAAACAERVVGLFVANRAAEAQIRDALERTFAYAAGGGSAAEEIAKRMIAVKAAGTASTPAGAAAARSVAQASAVAHMGAHALGPPPTPSKRYRSAATSRRSGPRLTGSWAS
ncbi:tellurite resistance/C4-dicarboxylate transporter family protein [Tessaracoccus coleopterorum]|uniref:tellurite resistance/C4-dicarboxylate transporter family protein n=1 Tax=Tessaracoccus coleopterorum TaxID=2714950 RepID=UPI001E446D38